jgi:hypothetical protein
LIANHDSERTAPVPKLSTKPAGDEQQHIAGNAADDETCGED